jgi:drug/metabolite transporter (DMT)-like permease
MLTRDKNPLLINQRELRSNAIIALGLISFTWGTTWMVSRKAVQYMPPLELAAIRQLLAGTIFVLFFLRKKAVWPKGREWISIFILSMLNFLLTNGLTTWGVKYISGGLAAIIAAIFPLWLILIGLFRNRSGVSAKALIGFFLGFAGICLIFYDHLKDFLNADFRFGIFISLTASLTWAFATLYTKRQAALFNPYFSIGLQMLISGVFLYLISFASGRIIPIQNIPWQSWAGIIYLALIGSVLSFFAYLYALQHLPTGQVSIYAYINPVVAVLLGSVILGEKLSFYIVLGGLVTLYGVYLVNQGFQNAKERTGKPV